MSIFIFGEAMLEYHIQGGSGLRFGGDTLNTAIHLARAGHQVTYVTALGTDPISDAMVAAWTVEGIDTRFVLRHPDYAPGIYAIRLDETGERSFLYWRDKSAAREVFDLPGIGAALLEASGAQLLYFSLISLAVIGKAGTERLLTLAAERKKASKAVAYDSNFRPSLWPNIVAAQAASQNAMQSATIGLPTNSDERSLWACDNDETTIARRWLAAGCEQVAVKAGEDGCYHASTCASQIKQCKPIPVEVVDSSGAGDAFNGGFLAAWMKGEASMRCIERAQQTAATTLRHLGAVSL